MKERLGTMLSTGIEGLDDVLRGGFAEEKTFVVKGGAGTGKTTLALQFLLEGMRNRQPCLFVGMGGAGEMIRTMAASHGWDPDWNYLAIHEVDVPEELVAAPKHRAFHPAEVDLAETIRGMLKALEEVRPKRLVIDTISDLRLLCQDEIEYRRQLLAIRKTLAKGECTAVVTDYGGETASEVHLEALAHGTIVLETLAETFGRERRRLRVLKYRANQVRSGWHDFTIIKGGLQVFPALVAGEHLQELPLQTTSSDNQDLDKLLGGGIERGSVTLLLGPSGSGKSSLASVFAAAAAERGQKASILLFEETVESYLQRSEGIGLTLGRSVEADAVMLRQLDVAEVSAGQFVHELVMQVEKQGVSLVVIDSLNGYINCMPDQKLLLVQLHELFTYLNHRGVTTFLTLAQHGLVGTALEQTVDVSFLADNILFLRFFESRGEVRRALSVIKKRRGMHETTIREIKVSSAGIELSEPLSRMRGVLTGVPSVDEDLCR
jgi:circadian clock protein KaiC